MAHDEDPTHLIAALPLNAVLALPSLPRLPTGHYEFSLGTVLHRQFVTRLKDVAHGEEPIKNNWVNIVHDKYSTMEKFPGNYGPPEAWAGVVPVQVRKG